MRLSFTNIRQRIDTIYKTVGKSVYDNQGNEVSYFKYRDGAKRNLSDYAE